MRTINRAIVTAIAGLALAINGATPATAERIWDIEAYDNCMVRIPTIISPSGYEQSQWECCVKSGGEFDFHQQKCVAPPAEVENVGGSTGPVVSGKPRPPLTPGTSVG
jgi:hypothetical protein